MIGGGVAKAKCNSTLMQMMHCANTDRVDDGSFNKKHYRSITE